MMTVCKKHTFQKHNKPRALKGTVSSSNSWQHPGSSQANKIDFDYFSVINAKHNGQMMRNSKSQCRGTQT
jgi:hypothetical protein